MKIFILTIIYLYNTMYSANQCKNKLYKFNMDILFHIDFIRYIKNIRNYNFNLKQQSRHK